MIFFSPKLFKPRRPFLYTSKYGTWWFFWKKIQCFLSTGFPDIWLQTWLSRQLFWLFKLNNYVVQLHEFTSVLARLGSRKIFLLLNDLSNDPHFLECQNIETLNGTQKISNFSLHRFSRYLTPNMALQKIILTSFLFFVCFSSSSRSRAMRSPRHNSSKILSNHNKILQTCSGVNGVLPNTFWVHSVQGFRS